MDRILRFEGRDFGIGSRVRLGTRAWKLCWGDLYVALDYENTREML